MAKLVECYRQYTPTRETRRTVSSSHSARYSRYLAAVNDERQTFVDVLFATNVSELVFRTVIVAIAAPKTNSTRHKSVIFFKRPLLFRRLWRVSAVTVDRFRFAPRQPQYTSSSRYYLQNSP